MDQVTGNGGEGNDVLIGRHETSVFGGQGSDTFIVAGQDATQDAFASVVDEGALIGDFDPSEDFILVDLARLNDALEEQGTAFDASQLSKRQGTDLDEGPVTVIEYDVPNSSNSLLLARVAGIAADDFDLSSVIFVELSYTDGIAQLDNFLSGDMDAWAASTGWSFEGGQIERA